MLVFIGAIPRAFSKNRSGRQAGAARVVVVKKPSDKLPRRIKAGDRLKINVENLTAG